MNPSEDCPAAQVIDHCKAHLADFKAPRSIAYMSEAFSYTPSRKIQQKKLITASEDLRLGAYDGEVRRRR